MKKILKLLSLTIILCTCSLSLTLSYFIPDSSLINKTIDMVTINNELEYDGESIIVPYEEKDINVTITSNNEFLSVFKLYHKDNLNITYVENVSNEIECFETINIIIHVKNESNEFKQLDIGIKSSLNINDLNLKEYEEWI